MRLGVVLVQRDKLGGMGRSGLEWVGGGRDMCVHMRGRMEVGVGSGLCFIYIQNCMRQGGFRVGGGRPGESWFVWTATSTTTTTATTTRFTVVFAHKVHQSRVEQGSGMGWGWIGLSVG